MVDFASFLESKCRVSLYDDALLISGRHLFDCLVNKLHLDSGENHLLYIFEHLGSRQHLVLLSSERLGWALDQVGRHLDKGLVKFPVDLDTLAFYLFWDLLKFFVLELHFIDFKVSFGVDVFQVFVYRLKRLIHLIQEVFIAFSRELVDQSNKLIVLVLCR